MQNTHVRDKLHLHRSQIVLLIVTFLALANTSLAQKSNELSWIRKRNPNYDTKKLTYGFLIGLHTSAYQIKYSDKFVSQTYDSVHSIEPSWSTGFSLGFIVNYRLEDLWDLRLTPKVGFYEHRLRYLYTQENESKVDEQLIETTMVEFPILLKFKSERRENLRMYMIGGVTPAIEASGKKDIDNVTTALEIKGGNLSLDVGFGLDIYYPLFKFSPEIRFSRGITDILNNRTNKYGILLDRVNTNTISLYLLFQ